MFAMNILRKSRNYALLVLFGLITLSVWADSLQLKSGTVIRGKYLGGTQDEITFSVDGKIQRYQVSDVLLLSFDTPAPTPPPTRQKLTPDPQPTSYPSNAVNAKTSSGTVYVPAGTDLVVRMIDSVDSKQNSVGDRFEASLDEDLVVDGILVARKGASVYGRLAEVQGAGRLAGKSELRLELTGIQINHVVQPVVTGDYEVSGKSRGSNTAKKVGGGAAVGALIGAIAGGGKGAAIGAGVGAGAGTAVQVLTHGEQVSVPSETVLNFKLQQPVTLPVSKDNAS
jgi:hypothetical protein